MTVEFNQFNVYDMAYTFCGCDVEVYTDKVTKDNIGFKWTQRSRDTNKIIAEGSDGFIPTAMEDLDDVDISKYFGCDVEILVNRETGKSSVGWFHPNWKEQLRLSIDNDIVIELEDAEISFM